MDAVHPVALATAALTLVAKEGLFRYMRRIGERLKSSLLIANAWHARADAASSLVVAVGIGVVVRPEAAGAGAALPVWACTLKVHSAAMNTARRRPSPQRPCSVDGVLELHGLRSRRLGDWAVFDVNVEVDAHLSVSEGHYIAEHISARVKDLHRVAECTVHIDPGRVRRLPQVLALAPRTDVQRVVQQVLQAPVWLRLHYLDSGLEVEAELQHPCAPTDLPRLEQALQQALQQHTRVRRVTLRNAPSDIHP